LAKQQNDEDLMSNSYIERLYKEVTQKPKGKKHEERNKVPVVMGKVINKRKTPRKEPTVTVYEPRSKKGVIVQEPINEDELKQRKDEKKR
jgi:hypothetical protein